MLRPYSEASFRRQFLYHDSPRRNKVVFIEKTKVVNQFQQYKVYGKIYNGLEEIVTNKLAKKKCQASYRLNSSRWPDYEYINKAKRTTKNQRTLSIDGQIKKTELKKS